MWIDTDNYTNKTVVRYFINKKIYIEREKDCKSIMGQLTQ